jgi:phospholipid/cholesterol/gamma-HCH transport system substrate-binding protein
MIAVFHKKMLFLVVAAVSLMLGLSGCKFDGAYDLPLPGSVVSKDDSYPITAQFTDALNVVPRTAVMLDDVPVGQVTEVDRKGWLAQVQMRIRKDLDLPANVTLDVRQTSLLGEKYIAIVRPTDGEEGKLQPNSFIPVSETGRNPEVEEVLGALSMVLGSGGIGQVRTISIELNKAFNGRTENVKSALTELNRTVSVLNDQRDDIVSALKSVDSLSAELVREKETIGNAVDAMAPAVATLNKQHDALIGMMKALDRLGVVGTRTINATKEDLLATLNHLGPALAALADAKGDLAKGIAMMVSYPFPKEAANIAQGDFANAEFYIDANLEEWLNDPTHAPNIVGMMCSLFETPPAECPGGYATRMPSLKELPPVSAALNNPVLDPTPAQSRSGQKQTASLPGLLGGSQ